MTAKLADKIVFNEKFAQYRFELESPHAMEFRAGQYISIVVAENGDRRSYSLCSNPDSTHTFELLIDHSPQGVGSQFLNNLQFGQTIQLMGPMGRFVVAPAAPAVTTELTTDSTETPVESAATALPAAEDAIVLVATGSGIAPMRSIVLDLLQDRHDARPIMLYWGLRHVAELFWQNEFQDLVEGFANFSFHPVISQAVDEWPLCRGRVTDCLNIHTLPENAGYYLCGSAAMIADTNQLLLDKGIAKERIHFEKFY